MAPFVALFAIHSSLSRSVRRPLWEVKASQPRPIDGSLWPDRFPAKEHCSRCGLCETSFVANVTNACAFLPSLGMHRIDQLEAKVHGRSRRLPSTDELMDATTAQQDEARFGILHRPIQLGKGIGIQGAQWTGVVTGIALSMLESGEVQAVACIGAGPGGWSDPQPLLARTPEDILKGRGVKPALAPSLRVLDEIREDESISRLLFCGVGCAVQAFRVIQEDLNLEKVYVLGTNCVDNSPSGEMAERFVRDGVGINSNDVQGYEFMQDFRVHVKTTNDYSTIPYFCLPGTIAEQSIAKSCLSCFDYTNSLADVVVGYMGAPLGSGQTMNTAKQTITCRNNRGSVMIQTALDAGRLEVVEAATGTGSFGAFAVATVISDSIVQQLMGETAKDSGIPVWLGEVLATALRSLGPKELNFARYSIDYHILRNYFYVLSNTPRGKEPNLPASASQIVTTYLQSDVKLQSVRDRLTEV